MGMLAGAGGVAFLFLWCFYRAFNDTRPTADARAQLFMDWDHSRIDWDTYRRKLKELDAIDKATGAGSC